jgi:ribosomal-protein-alanine N-acetyltransferase
MKNISVTPAKETDAAILAELHHACLGQEWKTHEIANILSNQGTLALLAQENGTADGFILLRCIAGEGEILNMGVVADAQKKGVGTALLKAATAVCEKENCAQVWLEVAEDNKAALHLYHAHGFTEEGKRKAYYRRADGSTVDAHILRLEIKR